MRALFCPRLTLNVACMVCLLKQEYVPSVTLEDCEEAAPLAGTAEAVHVEAVEAQGGPTMVYHWLPGRKLDAMRPKGCAIQYRGKTEWDTVCGLGQRLAQVNKST